MNRIAFSAVILAFASPALAQQPAAPPSEQALANKLMVEIGAGLQCSAAAITLQQQLAATQAKIKALEDAAKAQQPAPAPSQSETR